MKEKEKRKKPAKEKLLVATFVGKIVPLTPIEHRLMLLETIQTSSITPSEAFSRISEIKRSNATQDLESMMSLVIRREDVKLANFEDALEQARIRLGLDSERDILFNDLYKKVSVEKGFEMLSGAFQALSGESLKDINDLLQKFPRLTLTEIALLPFLERVPECFLFLGNDNKYKNVEDEDMAGVEGKFITPSIIGANTQGLLFSASDFDYIDLEKTFETDPYTYAGITGKREDMEFVPFRKDVKEVVDRLIPLVFTNNRLHERIWNDTRSTSLIIGFGRLDEEAYRRAFGELPKRDSVTRSFRNTIICLSKEQKPVFEEKKKILETKLVNSTIVDLGRDTILEDWEVFSLIGILEKIPDSFVGESPFYGYIQPYGPGVKIIDSSGKMLEYVKYTEFFLRQSVTGIFWEVIDIAKTNKTFADIFLQLQSQAESLALSKDRLSQLEEIKEELKLLFGINLNILPRKSLYELKIFSDTIVSGLSKDGIVEKTNSKLTLEEARDIQFALRLVPRELLEKVKGIKKVTLGSPLSNFMSGMAKKGSYLSKTQEIILYSSGKIIPEWAKKIERIYRIFAVLHEIGESIWPTLTDEEQQKYRAISWDTGEKDLKANFLTFYSYFDDERDDFCEHFASYIYHAGEFRQRAEGSSSLQQKYDFIKNLFSVRAGRALEYPGISPLSIEELHGEIEQTVNKMTLEEAWEEQRATEEREHQQRKKEWGKIILSVEEIVEKEEEDDEEEEDN